ncbi:MAG: DUF3109 family protein [Bacteroidales bacterium]|nr:DUF3109 family protein [Bacteroidales bacterium]
MIEIDDTLISFDVFDKKFCCDLGRCKGYCCVEGEAGAPLLEEEIPQIEEALPAVWEDLSLAARALINRQGVSYRDRDGESVTQIINGKDCVFTCYDEKGICYCALEKAWRAGKTRFMKPVSCHLYPIRLQRLASGKTAVNYQHWDVCQGAVECGRQLDLPVYRFLKEPLIRRFGQAWYDQVCVAAEWLKEHPQE